MNTNTNNKTTTSSCFEGKNSNLLQNKNARKRTNRKSGPSERNQTVTGVRGEPSRRWRGNNIQFFLLCSSSLCLSSSASRVFSVLLLGEMCLHFQNLFLVSFSLVFSLSLSFDR